jgi:lipoate-protein ligase B
MEVGMNKGEEEALVRRIREMDLDEGKVIKASGVWVVEGKQAEVPQPVIRLPHWTEGTKAVVIEGRMRDE